MPRKVDARVRKLFLSSPPSRRRRCISEQGNFDCLLLILLSLDFSSSYFRCVSFRRASSKLYFPLRWLLFSSTRQAISGFVRFFSILFDESGTGDVMYIHVRRYSTLSARLTCRLSRALYNFASSGRQFWRPIPH